MSDRQRFLTALRLAGGQGLHSRTVRRRGISGHPSERARELEAQGYEIRREREYIDGRNGVRFYLLGEPTAGVGGGSAGASTNAAPVAGHSPHPGGADAQPAGTPDSQGPGSVPDAVPSACAGGDRAGAGRPEGVGPGPASTLFDPAEAHEPKVPSAYDPWSEAA